MTSPQLKEKVGGCIRPQIKGISDSVWGIIEQCSSSNHFRT